MKINVNHTDKLQAAIDEVQKGCTTRKISPWDIQHAVEEIERHLTTILPKGAWVGLLFQCDVNSDSRASSWKHISCSTQFTLERTSSGWFVTRLDRTPVTARRGYYKPMSLVTKAEDIAKFVSKPF